MWGAIMGLLITIPEFYYFGPKYNYVPLDSLEMFLRNIVRVSLINVLIFLNYQFILKNIIQNGKGLLNRKNFFKPFLFVIISLIEIIVVFFFVIIFFY